MRIFFCGAPSDPIVRDCRRLGHEVLLDNWWEALNWRPLANDPQGRYGRRLVERVRDFRPDCFVLHKGWHGHGPEGTFRWHVPVDALAEVRRLIPRMLYWCLDDPADTPITIALGYLQHFDAYLSGCPGIVELFDIKLPVHEFWQGWDEDVDPDAEVYADLAETVAITGSPYPRPFPPPHYQGGFSGPRHQLVRALLDEKQRVGLWGGTEWLLEEKGGDPAFAPLYHRALPADRIHTIHRSAFACIGTHLVEGRRYESGRFVWVLGAGGVLIHEDRPGLRDEFDDVALWFPPGDFKYAAWLCRQLRHYPEIQQQQRDRGRNLVMSRHCWKHRAERLVELASQM